MLSFWIIAGMTALLVVSVLARAVMRPDRDAGPASDVAVYRAQLAEVERDAARGLIPKAEAEALRTEVARRLLAADAAAQTGSTDKAEPSSHLAMGLIIGTVLVSGLIYIGVGPLVRGIGAPGYGDLPLADRIALAEETRKTRPDQATAEAKMPPLPETTLQGDQYLKLVEQLRATVAERPNDLQGHILLASSEANTGNFSAAAEAQARVIELKRADVHPDDFVQLGEYMVMATGGYISPEAEAMFARALTDDPKNGGALYYYGLMFAQTGRPDRAFNIWNRLLREGPADARWIPPIRAQIEPLARLAGVRFTLPATAAPRPGPTQEDIDAAADMSGAERMEMIRGMVSGLSDRLASEGGPPEDWARLIASLGVLGERDRAAAIYQNGLEVFAGNEGALKLIRDAGKRAGVTQ